MKRCLEYQEQICILLGANSEGKNVFETHSGKVVMNFDESGILQEVETDKVLYRRRRMCRQK